MFTVDFLHLKLSGKAAGLIKKHFMQILIVISLMTALLMVPASARAEDESTGEAKSGFLIKPSSGLDIKADTEDRKNTLFSNHLPLADNIDIAPLFGEPQQDGMPHKKHSADRRGLLGFIFHF